MNRNTVSGIMLTLLLISMLTLALTFNVKSTIAMTSARTPQFWLLAVENLLVFEVPSRPYMRSAQFLISALLQYPNWNNSTEYTAHIHLLSHPEEVTPGFKPYLRGYPTKSNVESEIKNFLAQAAPGDIVVFYIECHGLVGELMDPPITYSELADWLSSGGLQCAYVTVILETCHSGSSINDGEGGVLGPHRNVLSSCMSNEWITVLAETFLRVRWMWFSHFIIEGFAQCNDSDDDGWISAAEVFEYAKPKTQEMEETLHQKAHHPVSYYSQVEGDVPLVQRDITKPFPAVIITSSPITGITFTINEAAQTTPHTELLLEGNYTFIMPKTHSGYVWSHWLEDGDTNRIKTVTITPGTTWTAIYIPAPDPFWMQWWFWTIVIAAIAVLVEALYFLKKRKPSTPTTPALPTQNTNP